MRTVLERYIGSIHGLEDRKLIRNLLRMATEFFKSTPTHGASNQVNSSYWIQHRSLSQH